MAKAQRGGWKVGDVEAALERIAPSRLAQSWDNVGLLAGDRATRCGKVLLCIDLTAAVLDEAIRAGCKLIMAYHPPIFRPIGRLLADSASPAAHVYRAIAAGVAVFSPHTALDAAPGGTNDVLAELCGLTDVCSFGQTAGDAQHVKLVTFVPEEHLERVSSEMFKAGAGKIGNYEQCSYLVRGEGTFFGAEGTNPQVGRAGRLERVQEVRIEVVAPRKALPEVVGALRRAHPYEEPAFDIHPLLAEPTAGIGRIGVIPRAMALEDLAARLREATWGAAASVIGSPRARIRRAAVCAGAAGRLPLEDPVAARCDVIVTGEIRHHDALEIARRGKCAIALGHSESERPVLRSVASQLASCCPGLRAIISRQDRSPFRPVL